ncbi:formimidoylglutamate deiminase [Cryobacterium sp. TMT2-10]|uniref:formimidoylglutamate deiminase n=1 Tax=Cryobacterium sp. TMT2-10 TaxID=1259244 RepID=UPI00106D106D|nr:formimidoylglutamate deiminase [Cryobacterium sp. TMT2-10]TFD43342.1 formimidoylglutamate deiminase [Cryobacterium sp. TMT2-10]
MSAATGEPAGASAVAYWCETLLIDGVPTPGVRLEAAADGRITRVTPGTLPRSTDVRLGTVLPGLANAHSHAFHRALRGRTHAGGGDFWQWREEMYRVAGRLDPDRYFALARAVFAEMLVSGFTAVGEFHYLHHRQDGSRYPREHAMELALAEAARSVGIRLVLLDTLYLAGGIGSPLEPGQRAFGDGSAAGWLARWHSLRAALASDAAAETGMGAHSETDADPRISLGAAIHSVRAVTPDAMREVLRGLPAGVPLHIHVSEQPQENADCLAAYGGTPTGVLAGIGALEPRLSLVHATHLSDDDVALIGASGATVVICPTTEADLGDGIGPALRLQQAGARIAIGSDQNAVVDPLLELRGLEAGERLASGRRGRFAPAELLSAGSRNGYVCLGLGDNRSRPGDLCDLVEVAADSIRTAGSLPGQLPLTATAADVRRVIVGGRVVADAGILVPGGTAAGPGGSLRPEVLLRDALAELDAADALEAVDDSATASLSTAAAAVDPASSDTASRAPGDRP